MNWLKKKKKLIDYDPKELSLEMLLTLQKSLVAKLRLINKEVKKRYRTFLSASKDLNGVTDSRKILSEAVDYLSNLDKILEYELTRGLGKFEASRGRAFPGLPGSK